MRLLVLLLAVGLTACGAEPAARSPAPASAPAPAAAMATPVPQTRARAGAASDLLAVLGGVWRVEHVSLAAGPVQALVVDDPAYMGAVLEVSPTKLVWRPGAATGELSDTCDGPAIAADGVRCVSGAFGPPGSRLATEADGRISLGWYDGAILHLARIRPPAGPPSP